MALTGHVEEIFKRMVDGIADEYGFEIPVHLLVDTPSKRLVTNLV
ncbi:MAG: hypothetical protein ABF992_12330 [Lentilactobacillus hilgardii]